MTRTRLLSPASSRFAGYCCCDCGPHRSIDSCWRRRTRLPTIRSGEDIRLAGRVRHQGKLQASHDLAAKIQNGASGSPSWASQAGRSRIPCPTNIALRRGLRAFIEALAARPPSRMVYSYQQPFFWWRNLLPPTKKAPKLMFRSFYALVNTRLIELVCNDISAVD